MESVRMTKSEVKENWLTVKYGKPVQVYKCEVQMKNMNGDSDGQYNQGCNVCFDYSYVKRVRGQLNS